MSNEKIITCTISTGSGSITSTDPKTLIEILFGTGDFPHVSCPSTINSLFGELEDGEKEVYTLTFEKRFTQEEIDNLPESDGDIH